MSNTEAGFLALLVLGLCAVGLLLSVAVGKLLDRYFPY